jgi:uncharacterized repeat protein (TIGR02543 family)
MKVIRFFLRLIAYGLMLALIAFVVLFALTTFGIIDNPYENKPEIINLSQSEIRLKRNNSFQLNAKVLPDNTRSRKILFKSDKPDIVTVNELTGFIEAKKNGVATITAYLDKYNNISAECMVIVSDNNIEITGITLNTKKVDLIVGGTFQLNFKLTPKESTLHEIEYMTSDPNIAIVDSNGKIEAKGIGNCNIIVSEKITGIHEDVEVTVHDREEVVEPKKIELSPKDIKINVGGSQKIKATITPSNANNTVTWESLDNSVAVVSKDGVVTGKSVGTTQIVGTTINGLEGYVNVTVNSSSTTVKVKEVKLLEHDIELAIGEVKNIEYDIIPSDATNQGVKLKSSDTNVITITGTKIKAVGAGNATLTIETNDGSHKDTASVKVKKVDTETLDTDIELSQKDVSINVNGTKKIEAKVLPENATYKTITWESSNKSVATVKDGLITGKGKGTTEIIVKSKHVTKKIRVVVNEVPVESISLNKTSATLNISDTISLVKTIKPSNATNKEVTWKSSNKSVATVSGSGVVTAVSSGTATITVTTSNNKSATCKITVKKSETPVTTYKVTFNPNGGSVTPTSKTVTVGNKYGELPTPTRSNYTYKGWYTEKSGGTKIISSTIVNINSDITLYAHWTKDTSNEYTINYKGNGATSGSVSSHVCKMNERCSIKNNGFVKTGYKFSGWTTNSSGSDDGYNWTGWSGTWKYTNGEWGIKNNTLTLYAMWKKESSGYDITQHVPSGYNVLENKSYSSATLKYKTISKDNKFYSLIWVKDAYKQLNCGNSGFNTRTKPSHFDYEIKNYGYQNKGMIGTNGGFAINGRDNIPVLATRGNLVVNDHYKTQLADGRSVVYGTLSIDKNGKLINKTSSDANTMMEWLKSNGARNAWGVTHFVTGNWQTGGGSDPRTTLCQIDENNFVLATGYFSAMDTHHKDMHDTFGCNIVVNLDGGGSTGMYYKTNTMSSVYSIYQYKRPNETTYRAVVDILYFGEQ